MADPALVSAEPWSGTDARAGLIERAVTATGQIGGLRVRIVCEPLLTTVDDQPAQSVRILFDDAEVATRVGDSEARVLTEAGVDVTVGRSSSPESSVRLLVRAVDDASAVTLQLPALGEESVSFTLLPQRRWSVHLVHHSHFDFGYTDPQVDVIAAQRSYLDSAVELINETADWPEEARFRWNAEALWAFSDWEKHRPQAEIDEFVAHVKAGSIGLSAMPYNLHTDTCSTDELHELLAEARRIRDQYGIDFVSAMQTDVPGQVAGLPDALSEVGVRYLAVAHNWAGRSQPHTNGALNLPRMFRWRSPAGREVIVWMTDSPHGLAYMEGPMVGFTESYETVEELFPAYLTALATRGYPFPPGVFGAHGEAAEGRDPYPWDVLHLRTQGFTGDNAPARLHVAELVRQWNQTWESPTLRVSRNEDFFAEAEERFGDELVTVQGDWGDWWVEGIGSAAVPLALAREAQAAVTDARSLSQLAAWLGGESVPDEQARARRTYEAISMFNEHTWGAGNSWTHSDAGLNSGERQWQWKVAQGLLAHQGAADFTEHALSYLAHSVAPDPDALVSYVVANATGHPRTTTARVFVKETLVPFGADFAVVDSRTSTPVAFTVEPQQNVTHRESGRWVTFGVVDAPGFGFVRFDLVPAASAATAPTPLALDLTPRAELLRLSNEHLQVVVDEQTSAISSIVELATGRELVNQESVAGFNAYIYDQYGSSGAGFNHLANKLSVSDRLELLATRTLARSAVIIERVSDAVEQRLVYEYVASGVDYVRVTLRLRHGEPRLSIENRISKPVTRTKESAFFAFPFAAANPVMRFEVSGGVTGDGLPHIPGAPQHMRAVRNWVSIEDGPNAVVWATQDAPLVEPHTIAVPYSPFPASTSPAEGGTIFSWVHNNIWDTNFPIEQGFEATFCYAVGVRAQPDESIESLAIATAADLVHPLRSVRARGEQGTSRTDTSASMLTLDDDRVQLVSVVTGGEPGTSIVRLQSFASEPVTAHLTVAMDLSAAHRATYLGDLGQDLTIVERTVEVTLEPFEVAAVHVAY